MTDVSLQELTGKLMEARRELTDAARPKAVERQHALGKLTARERIAGVVDEETFREIGSFVTPEDDPDQTMRGAAPADGVVVGTGRVEGRPVSVVANDFTTLGGSMGTAGGRKVENQAQVALREGHPLVMLFDSGGHRIHEALDSRHFSFGGDVAFQLSTLCRLSGWSPMIAVMMGAGFAGPSNYAAFADIVIMIKGTSTMGIAGPALVKMATGEDVDKEDLGSPELQSKRAGMVDILCDSEDEALDLVRRLLGYFPVNAEQESPPQPTREPDIGPDELLEAVPTNLRRAYDSRQVVKGIVDGGSFLELKPDYAQNLVTGLARLDGRPVGVLANQPRHLAGCLTSSACEKGAHFISMCDAFGIPLLFLIDTPGLLVGSDSERSGLLRRSAKMLYALGEATVPRFSVVVRKAYGIAYQTMSGGRDFGNDLSLVWPSAEVCGMQIEGAVDVVHSRELDAADDRQATHAEFVAEYRTRISPYKAVGGFGIDELIDPRETRARLIDALHRAPRRRRVNNPPKAHGIAPI